MRSRRGAFGLAAAVAALAGSVGAPGYGHLREAASTGPALPTGHRLSPLGQQTPVGSFPAALAVSPDGKWLVVTTTGYREFLTCLSTADGHIASQLSFNAPRSADRERKESLYFGLVFGPAAKGRAPLYVSRGPEDRISVYTLDERGRLTDTRQSIADETGLPPEAGSNCIAGLALSRDGSRLYAVHNATSAWTGMEGSLSVLDTASGKTIARVIAPAYPLAIAAVTSGPKADQKLYVTSERDGEVGVISVADPANSGLARTILTGDHPDALLLDHSQERLFVANAGSDTVSEIDTSTDHVTGTIRVAPPAMRGDIGATPTGLALSPDESRLYVTLGDLNAVAVVRLANGGHNVAGYIPVGWYPTALCVSSDGGRLFVANAKGVRPRSPNSSAAGPDGRWGRYIENIIEGTVSMLSAPADDDLTGLTDAVIANNGLDGQEGAAGEVSPLPRTGIRHVIYVIKENRTYDQVLGDLPQGNGDPSQTLFGKEVTPNQHSLAERFVLLDNFYCAGEVSADGWNWCTSGMTSEYAARNVPFNYSHRGRDFDFEGADSGTAVDLLGLPDVARAPDGYLWDACARQGVSYRNYGCFLAFGDTGPEGRRLSKPNAPTKKALVGHTDESFLRFDLAYADSDAWKVLDCPAPKQARAFGKYDAPSRIAEWKREFKEFVRRGSMPRLTLLRLPRDHTEGTSPGIQSPQAMVADNDYAVGELIDTLSHSPYWKDTAVFVVEDDAQDGSDHVDAHRSTCYVVSPYVRRSRVDHAFYNTDSVLHTIESLLGLNPMCEYDALAPVLAVFSPSPDNTEPFSAILPAREIVGEINASSAYRARDSDRMDFSDADRAPEEELNDIIWHSVRGAEARKRPGISGRARQASGVNPWEPARNKIGWRPVGRSTRAVRTGVDTVQQN